MGFIADSLLIAGAFAATFYCWVLAARLRRLSEMDKGVGAAIAVLNRQIEEVKKTLEQANNQAREMQESTETARAKAELAASRLEMLIAQAGGAPKAEERSQRVNQPKPRFRGKDGKVLEPAKNDIAGAA